jgi:hypothetical protein
LSSFSIADTRWPELILCHSGIHSCDGSGRQFDSIAQKAPLRRVFTGADSMPATATDLIRTVPPIVPVGVPAMSDDECLLRLAQAVEAHDTDHLDEVARLIARLAVTIE